MLFVDNVKQTMSVSQCYVCFVDLPLDHTHQCSLHPVCCGTQLLKPGQCVMVCGRECELVKGKVWYVAVRIVDSFGVVGCKVGIVKVLADQLHTVCNRQGTVSQILRRDYKNKEANVTKIWNEVTSRGKMLPIKFGASVHASSAGKDATQDMVHDMRGVAVVTFSDANRKFLPVVSKKYGYLVPNPKLTIDHTTNMYRVVGRPKEAVIELDSSDAEEFVD